MMGEIAEYYDRLQDIAEDEDRWFYDMLMKQRKNMPKTKKITKKFYVGSRKMNPLSDDGAHYNEWGKATLEQAIEHAKELCEESGESQIVVQIVRVVKPQKVPIVVEKL